ncbi:hypothetical protein PR202_gb25821 [Eleusine coracana subsp. coracana]|uniref:Amidase domain-containing protein n=1 Tax=Eleusine coracana subsp. coracana TaxID=191504 RepID=A0AAV5FPY2_ELECO|nr:hypothetical protein PR202_gb25785 [Eleusine coracana subsp. coracana]GJN36918.1 hypothetical protein PR202_gb25821 [Eleusine coracana subsp. coracana]
MAQLRLLLFAAVLAFTASSCHSFEFQEATLDAIHLGFKNGSVTSTALVQFYLGQIRLLNPVVHAVIEVNPDALKQAAKADAERQASGCRPLSALHGVPVLLKDNIATRDRLNTTAGSLALLGSVVKRDAGVVARLRRAGAVVLGKANMDEWANFRSAVRTDGWSARGGQGRVSDLLTLGVCLTSNVNPYVLSAPPCGSSTGPAIAAAANMAAVTLGTETDGSILCPSSLNSVVGIKPTVGLTSRAGVIPISPRQDTVGYASCVKYIPEGGYLQFLKIDGLKGKRIGVPNGLFDFEDGTARQMVYRQHLNTMRKHGAVVIENLEIENLVVIQNATISGEVVALAAEFKLSLNAYLSDLTYSPVRSLAEVIAFNNAHPNEEMLKQFGQLIFLVAENTTGIGSMQKAAIQQLNDLTTNGVEKVMKEHRLDAIAAPDSSTASMFALGGFPAIAVPAGYDEQDAPFGISLGGLKGYEPRLIEIAYAFEQASKVRKLPMFRQ